jgi:hypothetical protein
MVAEGFPGLYSGIDIRDEDFDRRRPAGVVDMLTPGVKIRTETDRLAVGRSAHRLVVMLGEPEAVADEEDGRRVSVRGKRVARPLVCARTVSELRG